VGVHWYRVLPPAIVIEQPSYITARAGVGMMTKDTQRVTDPITPEEAAELTGYNIQHVRYLAREGRIKAEKKGYTWWISKASILQWKRQQS